MSNQTTELYWGGKTTELNPGEVKQVQIKNAVLALYNINGIFYATDDTCTHAQASLAEGYLEDDVVECPRHQGCFHIPTGKALGPPVTQDIQAYPVKIVNEEIYIEVPQAEIQ